MGMTECPDCHHAISDHALSCVNCGRLFDIEIERKKSGFTPWSIITQLRAPINVFAFAMMAAAAVFGMYAVEVMSDLDLKAFAFALHVFLAIAGMFFVTLLFCPSRIYHPKDVSVGDWGEERPVAAVSIIVVMIVFYAIYQLIRLSGKCW